MKATGVVRRLDDLGRLVIPKEIRKNHHLLEGDSIEFFVNDESEIIIRKYQHLNENKSQIIKMVGVFNLQFSTQLLFYGDDELFNDDRKISKKALSKLKTYNIELVESCQLFESDQNLTSFYVYPYVHESEYRGSFILLAEQYNKNTELVLKNYLLLLQYSN